MFGCSQLMNTNLLVVVPFHLFHMQTFCSFYFLLPHFFPPVIFTSKMTMRTALNPPGEAKTAFDNTQNYLGH